MPDSVDFRVEGLEQKVRDLHGLGVDVEQPEGALKEIEQLGVRVLRGFVPEDTGLLASTVRGYHGSTETFLYVGSLAVPYAGPRNYGVVSRNIPASEFVQKTEHLIEPKSVQILETDINKSIQRRGLK